jgi:hypothetical protein
LAQARNPYSPRGLGIPGSRYARPGMTAYMQPHFRILAARRARVLLHLAPSSYKGSRECRAPDAPAALRAKVESTQASHHGHAGNTRHSPRNGFTAYSVLSRVTGLSCHPRRRNYFRQLDASVGASGPHGFAVRAQCHSSFDTRASTASRPASVTIASRPLGGTRRRKICR